METKDHNDGGDEVGFEPNMQEIPQHVKKFLTAKIEYYRLSIIEFIAGLGAKAASWFILGLVGIMILFFLSTGTALWLNDLIGSTYAGFFIVTGIYIILFTILYLIKGNSVEKPVTNAIIRKLANWKIEDEDEN